MEGNTILPGVIQDLVIDKNCPERAYYDKFYKVMLCPDISIENLQEYWRRPEKAPMMRSLGNLSGKRILLLGNGVSLGELLFLSENAAIVYTDLSVEALKIVQQSLDRSDLKQYRKNIEFLTVDATKILPFPESSFDIIYGSAFFHHLGHEDRERFLSEVCRCLKNGGKCRFLDGAFSPLWKSLKTVLFKSFRLYLYKKGGISPQDLSATEEGGFKKEQMIYWRDKYGFKECLFERHYFFLYIAIRLQFWLFHNKSSFAMEGFKYLMFLVDRVFIEHNPLMEKQKLILVWGYTK